MIRSNELKLVTFLFIAAFLSTWIMPLGVIFAEEDEESLFDTLQSWILYSSNSVIGKTVRNR